MHENEPAHWFDDGAMAQADERSRKLYFLAGREQGLIVAPGNPQRLAQTPGHEQQPGQVEGCVSQLALLEESCELPGMLQRFPHCSG